MRPVHSRQHHVALGDTDAAQVIYFAAVFRWHEQSLSEWLAQKYKPLSHILASGGGVPVVNCSANYSASVRQDEIVTLNSWVSDVGRSSFTFGTTVLLSGKPAVIMQTRHVWVETGPDGAFASATLPDELRLGTASPAP